MAALALVSVDVGVGRAALATPTVTPSPAEAHVPSPVVAWKPMAVGADRATVPNGDSTTTIQLFRFDLHRFGAEVVVGEGSPPHRWTAAELVHQHRAIAAVNGGFFDEHVVPLGLRIATAKIRTPLRPRSDWGVLMLFPSRARIVHTRDFQPDPSITGAIQVGPRIVVDGAPLRLRPQTARRTAVALDRDGRMLTLIVAGDAIEANDLAAIVAGIGFDSAVMLDGGPSTQLAVDVGATHVDVPGGYPVPDLLVIVPGSPHPGKARR